MIKEVRFEGDDYLGQGAEVVTVGYGFDTYTQRAWDPESDPDEIDSIITPGWLNVQIAETEAVLNDAKDLRAFLFESPPTLDPDLVKLLTGKTRDFVMGLAIHLPAPNGAELDLPGQLEHARLAALALLKLAAAELRT